MTVTFTGHLHIQFRILIAPVILVTDVCYLFFSEKTSFATSRALFVLYNVFV